MPHQPGLRRWNDQPRTRQESTPRAAPPPDPLTMAMSLLDGSRTRAALLKAVEERVKADPEERRRFAAAAGRVYRLTGEPALSQAVRNYLEDVFRSAESDRTATLVWLSQTVAALSGPGGADRRGAAAPAPGADPRAAAEALFRPRPGTSASAA